MATLTEMAGHTTERLDDVFRKHYDRIAHVIGRVIHDQACAEELAVDVFLKWWRSVQAGEALHEGWLYRTAVRAGLDELRRQIRRGRFERLFHLTRLPPPTPEHLYTVTAEQQNVRAVLALLHQRDAEVLLLRSQGLSYQELAAVLEVNPNSIGSLVSRAQEAFRKEYVKRYGNQI